MRQDVLLSAPTPVVRTLMTGELPHRSSPRSLRADRQWHYGEARSRLRRPFRISAAAGPPASRQLSPAMARRVAARAMIVFLTCVPGVADLWTPVIKPQED